MQGYFGKFVRIDLSNRTIDVQVLGKDKTDKYLGGAGIRVHLLYDETNANTQPLGPENMLAAFTGPFTGTRVPSTSRHHIMARSPLTGFLGESNVGGSWSVHFKRCGYDGIVVIGKKDNIFILDSLLQ